jgi:hypothetical protein
MEIRKTLQLVLTGEVEIKSEERVRNTPIECGFPKQDTKSLE